MTTPSPHEFGELPSRPAVVADLYDERLGMEAEHLARMQANGENNWEWTGGDYSGAELAMFPLDQMTAAPASDELGPHEEFLSSVISRQLAEYPDRPVLALDMGGGLGATWARIAQRFENEVQSGRVVLVVSNLTESGRSGFQPRSADGTPLDGPTLEMIRDTHEKGLVQFVSGTVDDLSQATVELPDGQHLPLHNNVTLLHESRSVTAWSKVPERDIPKAAELIADGGVYLVSDLDTQTVQGAKSYNEERARVAGIQLAHQALIQDGLLLQTEGSIGANVGRHLGWLIFTKSRDGSAFV